MMKNEQIPINELSIRELFFNADSILYQIPIYQRNYAWEKEEISVLVQDIYDAFHKAHKDPNNQYYFIGTLVTYYRGDNIFEVIDGQQRLTTIKILLVVLGLAASNKLTYRSRRRSDATLRYLSNENTSKLVFDKNDFDEGIMNGYQYAKSSIEEIVPNNEKDKFADYFMDNVHIIHYRVPKDIDLNHYFEVMNSRGEQLEQHEIVKAKLMNMLADNDDRAKFNRIWESCCEMSIFVQQKIGNDARFIFGDSLNDFKPSNFDDIAFNDLKYSNKSSILDMIPDSCPSEDGNNENEELLDSFQPIIDFPNFLLIVLKITRLMNESGFDPADFNLDDKELLNEFDEVMCSIDVKSFAYNLLKARFMLDNYVVHHDKGDDTNGNNPWKLQRWHKGDSINKGYPKNITDDQNLQNHLVHLLSMFEVSFTARQRKNYLFYCLNYLVRQCYVNINQYADFVEYLAKKYFFNVYLIKENLNAINTPLPGSFDAMILNIDYTYEGEAKTFTDIYGDGCDGNSSKGVPLFVFNYLDYCIWKKYSVELRGESSKIGSDKRTRFFNDLGCSDFGLDVFKHFYFSRTRRSLEHYYPQAMADGKDGHLNQDQINCIGNYAMIGSAANSSGSYWTPKTKLDHYLDASGKINQISVSSLKFMIMMQICRDKGQWSWNEIKEHENHMLHILELQ